MALTWINLRTVAGQPNAVVTTDDPLVSAAQLIGTRSGFADDDSKPDAPFTERLKAAGEAGFETLRQRMLKPAQLAKPFRAAETQAPPAAKETRGTVLLATWIHPGAREVMQRLLIPSALVVFSGGFVSAASAADTGKATTQEQGSGGVSLCPDDAS